MAGILMELVKGERNVFDVVIYVEITLDESRS